MQETPMDWTTLHPDTEHRFGRCILHVAANTHPKRPWAWMVRWSEEDGVAGEAETLQLAQRQAARAAERVAEIDRLRPVA